MKTLRQEDEIKLLQGLATIGTTIDPFDDFLSFEYFHYLPYKNLRNLLIGTLCMDTGIRVGELTRLTFGDLYFNGTPVVTLIVRKAIAKRNHQREVPLTSRLLILLQAYLDSWFSAPPPVPDLPLFSRCPYGPKLTTRTVERLIKRAALYALGWPVHPHMLRHTYATKLMRVTDIRTVQELMGHKNVTSTQIYTHVADDDKRQAIAQMQAQSTPSLPDPRLR